MAPWVAHDTELVRNAGTSTVGCPVASASHRGNLWCLWVDTVGQCWYAISQRDGRMGAATKFPSSNGGLPGLTSVTGELHAVVLSCRRSTLAHFRFDHDCGGAGSGGAWARLGEDVELSNIAADSRPTVCGFHNRLFAVFLSDRNRPYYAFWCMSSLTPSGKPNEGFWSPVRPVEVGDAGPVFASTPALFPMNGVLNLVGVTVSAAESEGIDEQAYRGAEAENTAAYRFDYAHTIWDWSHDQIGGGGGRHSIAIRNGCGGVNGMCVGDLLYLGLTDHDGAVSVVTLENGKGWSDREVVVDSSGRGGMASDIPQITVVAGRVHCVFHDSSAGHALQWFSHPTSTTDLSSWMAGLSDTVALSDLTIPGTHNSCARSDLPFVRTQYLDIWQQLAHGIRCLDLRLRRHDDDGLLYCYHGGIPIGIPHQLSFAAVMADVWEFLGDGSKSTETVLVSIANDSGAGIQPLDAAAFCKSVVAVIESTEPDANGRSRWITKPETPTLGQARGRVLLLRRFEAEPTAQLGLDLSNWPDNMKDFTVEAAKGLPVHIQDHWRYSERQRLSDLIADKGALVGHRAEMAAATKLVGDGGKDGWWINFASAVGVPVKHLEIAEAKWIAVGGHGANVGRWTDGVNVLMRAMGLHFMVQQQQLLLSARPQRNRFGEVSRGRTRIGITNIDFPELPMGNDVVMLLIELNFPPPPLGPVGG